MADCDDKEGTRRSLLMIAQILGVSPDVFVSPSEELASGPPSEAEEAELLRLFRTIGCGRRRRRCLDLIHAVVLTREAGADGID